MNIKLIKTEKDYKDALKKVNELWDNLDKTDELDLLTFLIEKYEIERHKIDAPDPVEVIKFRMEQLGMKKKDLAGVIGANRASEVLNKKRGLSIKMIKTLKEKLDISADLLI